MSSPISVTRRGFLALSGLAPLGLRAATGGKIPVGLEMFTVREQLKTDPMGTVKAVAQMGYDGVEFFAPYFQWTPDYAKTMRKHLDDLGIRCFSTHNGPASFTGDGLTKAIELNNILGSKYIVMASAGRPATLDDWKKVAATLTEASEKMNPAGLHAGYHNHQFEFRPIDGKRPMEVIADNTPKDLMLQLDVGTCVEAGSDPVAWIDSHPGRIRSLHLKEWSHAPGKGYRVLFGEGDVPWPAVLDAAKKTGGVEYFLIEQEGADVPPLEAAKRCLEAFRKLA